MEQKVGLRTDQEVQFASNDFTQRLESDDVKISMDGRGHVFDNIFIERLWRTVKYEDICSLLLKLFLKA